MHILIIPSERYVTPEEPVAGIFQYHQAHALKRAGVQVGVIAPMPRSLCLFLNLQVRERSIDIEFQEDQGIPTYRYHGWRWIPGRIPYWSSNLYLKIGQQLFEKYVSNHGTPDIIHAHNTLYGGVIANILKKQYALPFIITEHSSAYLINGIKKRQFSMVKDAMINANARLVVSPALGHALEKRFDNIVQPWKWVPNILNKIFEDTCPSKIFNLNTKKHIRFLTIGGLIPIKNHNELLMAFARAFKDENDIQLRIGGDGPLRQKLEHLSKQLGISKQVVFLGILTREQVLNEMNLCDIFVLSSNHETFGVVIIEALACGKPVIATDCGGPRCIIREDNGLLISVNDEHALASAMQKMRQSISLYNAEDIRADCINRFGEKVITEQLKKIYAEILADNKES